MKTHRLAFPLFIVSLFSGCFGAADDLATEGEDPELLESVASQSSSLTKGSIGAINGQDDYCADPGNRCVSGEGDCDRNTQCSGGAVCLVNNGAKFGFSKATDVCAPSHCSNLVLDAGQGETNVDCGGPCGSNCLPNCSGSPGAANFCSSCLCGTGEGDCDGTSECQPGLVCASNNGPNFDLPAAYDVCVPAHCTNGSLDAGSGETGVDSGGPCSGGFVPPTLNAFFSEYVEGSGLHHHLEIYNAGTVSATCTVNLFFSGATTAGFSVALSAPVAAGNQFVLCRSGSGLGSPPCNQSVSGLQFNGDDAIELICNATRLDVIGQIGFDPGGEWGTGLTSTADNTLRRKCAITSGDTNASDAFNPATQWDGFANNTFADLGNRTCP